METNQNSIERKKKTMSNIISTTISFDINLNSVQDIKDFCEKAAKADFQIDITSDRYTINAKSIMGLFSLDLSKPVTCVLHTNMQMANEFMESVKKLMV